jgi:hypothetical protein
VELISAMVDHGEEFLTLPPTLRIRFFLPSMSTAFVTVRELNYRHFYWLDHLRPSPPWKPGYNNVFEWPTADVLRFLSPFSVSDLGGLARLDVEGPRPEEHIAPVALCGTSEMISVERYVFSFRPAERASIQASLHAVKGGSTVATFQVPVARSSRAFGISWHVGKTVSGEYRLIVEGTNASNNRKWVQHVIFHHEPVLS